MFKKLKILLLFCSFSSVLATTLPDNSNISDSSMNTTEQANKHKFSKIKILERERRVVLLGAGVTLLRAITVAGVVLLGAITVKKVEAGAIGILVAGMGIKIAVIVIGGGVAVGIVTTRETGEAVAVGIAAGGIILLAAVLLAEIVLIIIIGEEAGVGVVIIAGVAAGLLRIEDPKGANTDKLEKHY